MPEQVRQREESSRQELEFGFHVLVPVPARRTNRSVPDHVDERLLSDGRRGQERGTNVARGDQAKGELIFSIFSN